MAKCKKEKCQHKIETLHRLKTGVASILLQKCGQKKRRTKEVRKMSDREKLIAEITEGLNDLDEKSLEMVREYVLLPFVGE